MSFIVDSSISSRFGERCAWLIEIRIICKATFISFRIPRIKTGYESRIKPIVRVRTTDKEVYRLVYWIRTGDKSFDASNQQF